MFARKPSKNSDFGLTAGVVQLACFKNICELMHFANMMTFFLGNVTTGNQNFPKHEQFFYILAR